MNYSNRLVAGALVLLGILGASCAAPHGDSPSVDLASVGRGEASSAGFDQWLREQCPDGAQLSIMDSKTHTLVGTNTCEDIREKALADASVHDHLVNAYLAQLGGPVLGAGEPIGEAKEPWSIFGFLCDLITAGVISYQCEQTHSPWSSCWAAGVAPAILCQLI